MPWTVRKSIYDSWAEEQAGRRLRYQWSRRFEVYDHQPLLSVLGVDLRELPPIERQLAKSMSFDFTFTTRGGRPVLSIEYDGLGQGFSSFDGWALLAGKFSDAAGYHPQQLDLAVDPRRIDKMRFKLKAAAQAMYPVIVVGPPEVRDLAPGLRLSVLDGMIGRYLAGLRLPAEAQAALDAEPPTERLDPELAADLLAGVELGVLIDEDPIERLSIDVREDLLERGVDCGFRVDDVRPRTDPLNPSEPIWEAGAPSGDPVWTGAAWSTQVPGVGEAQTRFANRNVAFLGYSSEVFWWTALELLHSLHIRQELTTKGLLPPIRCPLCGANHAAKDHPRTSA
jgi:hypothetical protein